jgi:hypothetical protein
MSYLEMKESRLKKMETLLKSKQDNFELLCESRIREKVAEIERSLKDGMSADPAPNPAGSKSGETENSMSYGTNEYVFVRRT